MGLVEMIKLSKKIYSSLLGAQRGPCPPKKVLKKKMLIANALVSLNLRLLTLSVGWPLSQHSIKPSAREGVFILM
jgi:hypothetical protein